MVFVFSFLYYCLVIVIVNYTSNGVLLTCFVLYILVFELLVILPSTNLLHIALLPLLYHSAMIREMDVDGVCGALHSVLNAKFFYATTISIMLAMVGLALFTLTIEQTYNMFKNLVSTVVPLNRGCICFINLL